MKINKYLLYCILITIVGFALLFMVNGVYPFGPNQISLLDFDNGYIPVYYKLWDVLHLKSTPFWDWNLGTGLNSFGSLIGNGFVSPLCWIIAIFPRSSIPYTISYVYFAKMIFVSIMAYYGISKIFPNTKEKYKVLFALMYTFSSWTFMMSTNLLYVDAFAIFPLFVYSLKELLEKGHYKLYTFLLTLTLLMSYYIAWLDLFFIIGTTGIYLLTTKTDHKKEKAVKILICTLLSLLFSCILFLPGFMFAKTSTRMANNTSNDGIFAYFKDKSLYLFTLAIPFWLTFKQLLVKKDKKLNIFIILMLVFLLLGVFIEPINALWHTGSHSGFPFRYAYQPTFFMILVSIYYLNNNHEEVKSSSKSNIIFPVVGILYILINFILLSSKLSDNQFAVRCTNLAYIVLLNFFIFSILIYRLIIKNEEKIAFKLTVVLFVLTSATYGYLYEGFLNTYSASEAEKITSSFNLKKDGYNYLTDFSDMNINFPYILKVPSIGNRIHFIRQEFIDEVKYLGYNYYDTIIYPNMSNMFNNLLLQNKYYFSKTQMDEKYYELLDEKNGIKYYQSKYNLDYILPYNGNDYNKENNEIFENSNEIYKKLFDGTEDIYIKKEFDYSDNNVNFKAKKGQRYEIELHGNGEIESVDDIKIVSSVKSLTHTILSFISNVDGDVKFKINGTIDNIYLYEFNENEFLKFVNNNQQNVKVKIDGAKKIYTYESLNDTAVLLPINYDDNYTIKVNGKTVDYKLNLYNMLSIDVEKGVNEIEVSYNQKWFKMGIKISIISVLAFAILYLINKKIRFINYKVILWPLFIIACLFFIILIGKVYLFFWI